MFLERNPGYGKMFGKIDLQMVDMGIAMCHLALTAREYGKEIMWNKDNVDPNVDGMEYVISAKLLS
jgi:hypothetical protein